jgi:hypothetical protein
MDQEQCQRLESVLLGLPEQGLQEQHQTDLEQRQWLERPERLRVQLPVRRQTDLERLRGPERLPELRQKDRVPFPDQRQGHRRRDLVPLQVPRHQPQERQPG